MTEARKPRLELDRNNAGSAFIGVTEFDPHTDLAVRSYVLSHAGEHTADSVMFSRFNKMQLLMAGNIGEATMTDAYVRGAKTEYWLVMDSSNNSDDGLQGPYPTIEAAKEDRVVSGQYVADSFGYIVADESWLWDWEAEQQSWAWRMMQEGRHERKRARHVHFNTSNWEGRGAMSEILPPGYFKQGSEQGV